MRDRGAPVQAYNAQALVGEGRIIIAADVTSSPNDSNQLLGMLQAARQNLQAIGHDNEIKCVLADGGYWNHDDIASARQSAVVVIPTSDPHNNQRKQQPRQGAEADRINKILANAAGKRLYRRRAELVEPVFAHTKHTRRITRFSRRGHTPSGRVAADRRHPQPPQALRLPAPARLNRPSGPASALPTGPDEQRQPPRAVARTRGSRHRPQRAHSHAAEPAEPIRNSLIATPSRSGSQNPSMRCSPKPDPPLQCPPYPNAAPTASDRA